MRGVASVLRIAVVCLCLTLLSHTVMASEPLQTNRIQSPVRGLSLALHHMPAQGGADCGSRTVLFIHGASFPSRLAAGYPFGGESWMAHLAQRGCDVWALDFLGYGDSSRYPEMRRSAQAPPLGRAPKAAKQITAAVDHITRATHAHAVLLIAHSWGTIPAALFTIRSPERVSHLVLFGPVTWRDEPPDPSKPVAYFDVTIEQQQKRFDGYVPAGEPRLIDRADLKSWSAAYLASDPTSSKRTPNSVRVPSGPGFDAEDAWRGRLAYDPSEIRVPTFIVYGEWDEVTRDADAAWLANAIGRSDVRVRKLPRGTHVMHLESNRESLYSAVDDFAGIRPAINGYSYGKSDVARSPVTLTELAHLETSVGWTPMDEKRLRQSCVWIAPLAESLVDKWRDHISKADFLSRWSEHSDGTPAADYRLAVKRRFVQWVRDTCERRRDQAWLDYADEIALRHTPIKKNSTDHAQTPQLVPLRYVMAFGSVISTSIGQHLQSVPAPPDEIAEMQRAWNKIIQLQLALWTRPYTREGWW